MWLLAVLQLQVQLLELAWQVQWGLPLGWRSALGLVHYMMQLEIVVHLIDRYFDFPLFHVARGYGKCFRYLRCHAPATTTFRGKPFHYMSKSCTISNAGSNMLQAIKISAHS
ncbi:hypothetical protein CYD30_18510 [Kosakonia cowanii]|nr:hypothetical protein CYD30_18510 [Kosakonia cowanii]